MENLNTTQRYYQQNKTKIKQQVAARRRMVANSDKYIDARRPILIEALNSGEQKYIARKTMDTYSIAIDPRTLKYYHNVFIGDVEASDNTLAAETQ